MKQTTPVRAFPRTLTRRLLAPGVSLALIGAPLVGLAVVSAPGAAQAAGTTITVSTTADSGAGGLRAAITTDTRSRAVPRSLPAPTTAHAVIRTIPLGADGLAVGTGGAWTATVSDDTIYVASNNSKVTVIDPVLLAVTGTVNVGGYPIGVAVSRDDTVYVVNANSDNMSVFGPRAPSVTTVSVPDEPQAVAVSRVSDDTLYISSRGTSQAITTLNARTLSGAVSTSIGSNATPQGLALSSDDSAYIATWPNEPRYFNSRTRSVTNLTSLGTGFIGVAVTSDDTVYMTNENSNTVKSFAATSPGTVASVSVASSPQGVAAGPDDTVYVVNRMAARLTVINSRTNQVDDSVNVGTGPYGVGVTRGGIIVTANQFASSASIVAALSPSIVTTSALAGDTGSLTIGGLPTGVTADDTTVKYVSFGDDTVVWSRTPGTNTFTGLIPPGSGSVPVVVALNGGNSAYAGSFTYASPAPPAPPTPATAPRDVTAVAGDASAAVSWSESASTGSYPVSHYQVTSSPGGRTCVVVAPALSCDVAGLANGTPYTFTVSALTGAGWSAESEPSNAVVPRALARPSVVITGSRAGERIEVSGTTTGMGVGGLVTPWTSKSVGDFAPGRAVLVSADGSFTWSRRASASVVWRVYFTADRVRSNTVTIR